MRAAALTYAFDVRQATVARTHVVSPRGEPVDHTDLEVRRERFRSPVPVTMDGVRPLA
jgi:hypothetical protein